MTYIWENGVVKKIDSTEKIDFLSSAFRYGIVLFDALIGKKIKNRYEIFRPLDHLDRLFKGIASLGMQSNFSNEDVINGMKNIVLKNHPENQFAIRIFAYCSSKTFLSSECSLIIFLIDTKFIRTEEKINLWYSPDFEYSCTGIPSSIKCTSHYVNRRFLMLNHIKKSSYSINDVVYVDNNKNILETSKANIFIIKGGKIYTPSSKLNILNGITRQSIIEAITRSTILKEIKVHEVKMKVNELKDADEIFLTSTSIGVEIISKLNNKKLKQDYSKIIKQNYNEYIVKKDEWAHSF